MKVEGLKLKSADEFEALLKSLADGLFHAKVHFTILTEMHRLRKDHQDEINLSLVFWSYTFRAHADLTLMRVFQIYDQHGASFHLFRMLKTVQENEWLFSREDSVLDLVQVEKDIAFVSEANPQIKNLKKWRDEIMFHKDPRHLLSNRQFEADNPLPYPEVSNLIEEGTKIVNRYAACFNGAYYDNNTDGWKDVNFVFESLAHHPYVVERREYQKLIKETGNDAAANR